MYFKLTNEDGEYLQNGEPVNLLYGNDIWTPDGKVSPDNLLGYLEFQTTEEAETHFGIVKKEL